jgi:hypothetical protein
VWHPNMESHQKRKTNHTDLLVASLGPSNVIAQLKHSFTNLDHLLYMEICQTSTKHLSMSILKPHQVVSNSSSLMNIDVSHFLLQ